MSAMRKVLLGVTLTAALVAATGTGAAAEVGEAGSEADLAHHGHVSLWDGDLGVWLVSENHGPSDVHQATVRLAFSAPMAGGQELPSACLWNSDRVISCRTGELRAAGAADEIALALRTAGRPEELTVDIRTVWRDGAPDGNPRNDRHHVLVLATGDPYVF